MDVPISLAACPAPCEAMLLPRDMESFDDCVCRNGAPNLRVDSYQAAAFRCPTGSTARMIRPLGFADCSCLPEYARDESRSACTPVVFRCLGRYTTKAGVETPASIADCDCQHPYTKDDATGQCTLRECPRAGNYVEKPRRQAVTSLADCTCLSPFEKNDQTGECSVSNKPFQCPPHSRGAAMSARPRSFADCSCDWGFVRSAAKGECVRESASYVCPRDSAKRGDLPVGANPRGFFDCECLQQGSRYARNEFMQSCDKIRQADSDPESDGGAAATLQEPFTCPPFSKPLAALPHSVAQCECLPGYGWQTPEMACVRLSTYACPLHAYKASRETHVAESFADCECASGYYRDDGLQRCSEWFLANDNGCPAFAYLKHWPLQSRANCECIYGLQAPDPAKEKPPQTTTTTTTTTKTAPKCNDAPSMTMDGAFTFSECPANAFANDWPVASVFDCSCLYGFEVAPASDQDLVRGDGELFQCGPSPDVDFEEQALTCRPPMVINPLTGLCRLPLEEVQPRATSASDGAQPPSEGTVLFRGIEYDYVLTDDNIMVTQGDIAIGEMLSWNATPSGDNPLAPAPAAAATTTHVLHGYYNSERDHRWEDGALCFQVDLSARRFDATVRDAMAHITAVTGFAFRECAGGACRSDPQCSHDFVNVRATASSCYSFVGRIGGQQPLGVSAQCGVGNVIHVLLHAVGLRHTIDRADRDDHVRIAWECVPAAKRTHFVVEQETSGAAAAEDTPYDFFSIMHHPSDAFVRSAATAAAAALPSPKAPAWCQSVFPRISDMDERLDVLGSMGQRELLAVTDIHAIWKLYPSLQANDKPATYESLGGAGNGTESGKLTVFGSRLHSQEDTREGADATERATSAGRRRRRFSQRATSFVGAIVTLGGFGAFLAFAVAEIRKRALLGSDAFYSESLLTDKALYD
ncbi:hypothetical protein PybrP1_001848 [[Pythium] brassicae (nom. inval.)]|nr:hypothetical protein PybrP1_001848 [[Pythium] brassicae (nom. inval.)]